MRYMQVVMPSDCILSDVFGICGGLNYVRNHNTTIASHLGHIPIHCYDIPVINCTPIRSSIVYGSFISDLICVTNFSCTGDLVGCHAGLRASFSVFMCILVFFRSVTDDASAQ